MDNHERSEERRGFRDALWLLLAAFIGFGFVVLAVKG
jgi:hypothetical protein